MSRLRKWANQDSSGYDRRSIQKLIGVIESQRGEINRALEGDEKLRRDQQLLHENKYWNKIENFVELVWKVSMRWKNWSDFQGSTFDTFSMRKSLEDWDTVLELTGKIQELQNEVNCMNDSRDFKMLNQYAVDNPTLPVNQRFSHFFKILAECKAVLWECQAAAVGRQVFGTRMVYRETFLRNQWRLL